MGNLEPGTRWCGPWDTCGSGKVTEIETVKRLWRRRRQEIVAEVTETATGATIERQWPDYSGAIRHIEARTAVGIETASSHIEECTSSNSSEKE